MYKLPELPYPYQWTMVSGKGINELDNDRYPHIKPISVKQFVASANF